ASFAPQSRSLSVRPLCRSYGSRFFPYTTLFRSSLMVEFSQSEGPVSSMRILVLSDIGSSDTDNPFTRELVKGLISDVRVLVVDYGKFWLDTDIRNRWDTVIVQWPEYLVRPDDEISLEAFIHKLKVLRSFGKVVTVIHNLTPHYRESVFNRR